MHDIQLLSEDTARVRGAVLNIGGRRVSQRWMTGLARGLLVSMVITLMSFVTTAPTVAECVGQPNRWPSFRAVAPTAQRIIVGTVIGGADQFDHGSHVAYRLRVEEVLKGRSSPTVVGISGLRSHVPLRGSSACRADSYASARVDDRIAIAYGGRIRGVKDRVNAVAWIAGRPDPFHARGAERLSLRTVRRIAGHAPDGSTLPPGRGIERATISLLDVPGRILGVWRGLMAVIQQLPARLACRAHAEDIPGVRSTDRGARLAAAYRMSGPEIADYTEGQAQASGISVTSPWRDVPGTRDLCIFDGDFRMADGRTAKRVLVLIGDDGPRLWARATSSREDIPLVAN